MSEFNKAQENYRRDSTLHMAIEYTWAARTAFIQDDAISWEVAYAAFKEAEKTLIGSFARFDYPKEFVTLPDYSAHRNQIVKIVALHGADYCDQQAAPMYRIECPADGWTGDANLDELNFD